MRADISRKYQTNRELFQFVRTQFGDLSLISVVGVRIILVDNVLITWTTWYSNNYSKYHSSRILATV
ncbi:unnamed protein product [Trifolium pratense]|uniref:Uncharacterized protein n=1 Tax=Trifolium pratense TaxID=57577 RepID=A0ACB0J7P0_TRIPR|nr:unnamed protein product [Trifolium pratense]